MLSSQPRDYLPRQRQVVRIHIWPFSIGATRHQPVLERHQLKGCLEDALVKTLLPTAGTLLQPKIVEGTENKLKERKANQECYYNKGTRELPELLPGNTVRMKPLPTDCEKQLGRRQR